MTDKTCSEQSCDVGEGLAGTAAEATRWLLLEYTGEWKPKGYDQADLPAETRAAIDAAVKANKGLRVQLIRRAERRIDDAPLRLFLARSERAHAQLWELSLARYADVTGLDLVAWATGADPFPQAHRTLPLYLVCVHGKRDRCCAQKGMPVYRRLTAIRAEATWQTTHLGGHRFAATLVCLPQGVCFGRVAEDETEGLVLAHERGEIYDLERYRGRSCDDAATQAADMLLRGELREAGIDAVIPRGIEPAEQGKIITLEAGDGTHRVHVAATALPLLQQSCDAPDRKPGMRFVRL